MFAQETNFQYQFEEHLRDQGRTRGGTVSECCSRQQCSVCERCSSAFRMCLLFSFFPTHCAVRVVPIGLGNASVAASQAEGGNIRLFEGAKRSPVHLHTSSLVSDMRLGAVSSESGRWGIPLSFSSSRLSGGASFATDCLQCTQGQQGPLSVPLARIPRQTSYVRLGHALQADLFGPVLCILLTPNTPYRHIPGVHTRRVLHFGHWAGLVLS